MCTLTQSLCIANPLALKALFRFQFLLPFYCTCFLPQHNKHSYSFIFWLIRPTPHFVPIHHSLTYPAFPIVQVFHESVGCFFIFPLKKKVCYVLKFRLSIIKQNRFIACLGLKVCQRKRIKRKAKLGGLHKPPLNKKTKDYGIIKAKMPLSFLIYS